MNILILGGASDIGQAIAYRYADKGASLHFVARKIERLETIKADLETRHEAVVSLHELDMLDTPAWEKFCTALEPVPDVVVSVIGFMGKQPENEQDTSRAAVVMRSNFEAPALALGLFANRMEQRGSGTIIGVSSVAGDRGRATNYVYGAAKAGFTAFLSGLRNRLAKKGVHVLTVKPGFVATAMTAGMDLPEKLTASPEAVAEDIWQAATAGKNILYTKKIWWLVMTIICAIPERIFKGLKL